MARWFNFLDVRDRISGGEQCFPIDQTLDWKIMIRNRTLGALALVSVLGACGGGGGDDDIDGAVWTSKGNLSDESGVGISGATVSVTLDKAYSTITDASGNFNLKLPQSYAFPTHFAGLATKSGMLPKPVLFSYINGKLAFTDKLVTRAVTDADVLFLTSMRVIHLGDSNYTGAANSQFQHPDASGTVWSEDATISGAQRAKYSQLCFNFYAKGLDDLPDDGLNLITISNRGQGNTYVSQTLGPSDSGGAYTQYNRCFSISNFKAEDVVRVQLNSTRYGGDHDDFEFVSVTGVLQ